MSAREKQATAEQAFVFLALINEQAVCKADNERRRCGVASGRSPYNKLHCEVSVKQRSKRQNEDYYEITKCDRPLL